MVLPLPTGSKLAQDACRRDDLGAEEKISL